MTDSVNESVKRLFVVQPRLHQVRPKCSKVTYYFKIIKRYSFKENSKATTNCQPLSFAIFTIQSLTRILLSTFFQNPGCGGITNLMNVRTYGQRTSLCIVYNCKTSDDPSFPGMWSVACPRLQ